MITNRLSHIRNDIDHKGTDVPRLDVFYRELIENDFKLATTDLNPMIYHIQVEDLKVS